MNSSPFAECSIYKPDDLEDLPKGISGVYAIHHRVRDKYYVGAAAELYKRLNERLKQFEREKRHHSIPKELWEDWKRCEGKHFEFLVMYTYEYHEVENNVLLQLGTGELYNRNGGSVHPDLSADDVKDFWSNAYRPPSANSCWVWQGGRAGGTRGVSKGEYGKWKKWRAHRIAYLIWYGAEAFPPSLHVMHKCSNKLCVNPDHLMLGTNQENSKDYYNREKLSVENEVATCD